MDMIKIMHTIDKGALDFTMIKYMILKANGLVF